MMLFPHNYSSDSLIKYLRKKGALVGENVYFYAPRKTHIDVTNPRLLKIGNNCSITMGAIILTHDYSYSVLNEVYGIMPASCKKTIIGNNCFIGMNAIILSGSVIGDNCIIGAGSVVSGVIPNNTVWGGSPARQICTLAEFKEKRLNCFCDSAKTFVEVFREDKLRNPSISEMGVYIDLFLPRTPENKVYFDKINSRFENVGNNLYNHNPTFSSFEEFIDSISKN